MTATKAFRQFLGVILFIDDLTDPLFCSQSLEYRQYLEEADRPPVHLLRILPSEEMHAQEVDQEIISNKQVGLFDSL
jgi:hypothetical protein